MGIHPKRPERVIQIEHHHLGKGQSVAEGLWTYALLNHDTGAGRFELLYRLFDHVGGEEKESGQDQKGRYERQRAGEYWCGSWEAMSCHEIGR